jgi:hypothetical protein
LDAVVPRRKPVRCIRHRKGASATIRKHEVSYGDEVGTCGCERFDLFQRLRKSDTGYFEQIRPPRYSFLNALEGSSLLRHSRLAEHDVISACLAGDHCFVPGGETAAAGDTLWLESGKRQLEGFYSIKMGAIGTHALYQIGSSVEKKSRSFVLHDRGECLGLVNHNVLIGRIRGPQQNRGNVGRTERFCKPACQIGNGLRGHKVKTRDRMPNFGRVPSKRHGSSLAFAIGRKWGRL